MKPPKAAFSASELSKAECTRAWVAHYCTTQWGAEQKKASTVTGGLLHEMNEAYTLTGQQIDGHPAIREIFLDGLKWLAYPGHQELAEHQMFGSIAGLPFQITADWFGDADALPKADFRGKAVSDYKTSVNPGKYGLLTHGQKITDYQSVLYAFVLGKGEDIFFRHVYYTKTSAVLLFEAEHCEGEERERTLKKAERARVSPKTLAGDAVLTGAEVVHQMEQMILPRAEKLWRIRSTRTKELDPLDYEPNWDHCDAYGGCPYAPRCMANATQAERVAHALKGMSDMSFSLFGSVPQINGPAAATPATPAATLVAATPAPASPAAQPVFAFKAAPPTPVDAVAVPAETPADTRQLELPLAVESATLREVTQVTDAELGAALRTLLRAWRE